MASRALSKELRAEISRGKRRVRENAEERAESQMIAAGVGLTVGGGAAAALDAKLGRNGKSATWGKTKIPVNVTVGPVLAAGSFLLDKGVVRSGLIGLGVGAGLIGGAKMIADKLAESDDDDDE